MADEKAADVVDAVVAVATEEECVNRSIVGRTVCAVTMGESVAIPQKDTSKMLPWRTAWVEAQKM